MSNQGGRVLDERKNVWLIDGSLTPSSFIEVDAMTIALKGLEGQNPPNEWDMILNWEESVQRLEETRFTQLCHLDPKTPYYGD